MALPALAGRAAGRVQFEKAAVIAYNQRLRRINVGVALLQAVQVTCAGARVNVCASN